MGDTEAELATEESVVCIRFSATRLGIAVDDMLDGWCFLFRRFTEPICEGSLLASLTLDP